MELWNTIATLAVCAAVLQTGCASPRPPATAEASPPEARESPLPLRDRWGVEVSSLRLSAAGRIVDFRYRVIDPARAAGLGDRRNKPYLIDQATGVRLSVPSGPKTGPLRQSAAQMEAGRIYFILFSNSGGAVKSGSKVTVVVGDLRAEDLTVE